MQKKLLLAVSTLVLILGTACTGSAAILYSAVDNGGGNHTLTFEVENDWGTDIQWFSIYFGTTTDGLNFTNGLAFSNFSPDSSGSGSEPQPAGWDSYSFEPSALDMPGQFNSDTLGSGIANNTSLGGFNVSFDWTGAGSYDALFFEVGDNMHWDPLFTGYTELKQGPGPGPDPVPEPCTIYLLGMGLLGAGILVRKKWITKA